MLKIFQIISFVFLAVSIAVAVLVFTGRSDVDSEIRRFLESPLTAEKYKGSISAAIAADGSKSPLVSEAEALSLRLNPPPPPRQQAQASSPSPRPQPAADPAAAVRPQAPVVAKFDLIGTCVNHDAPELSMIYIDIPGEGRKWVYQGEVVGRLTIAKITENSVVYSDGGVSNELAISTVPSTIKSLLAEDAPEAALPAATVAETPSRRPEAAAPAGSPRPTPIRTAPPTARAIQRPVAPPMMSPEQQKQQLESSLELMSDWKTGDEEADKELAETMKSLQKLMNAPK